jgi:hypothetical protein
MPPPPRPASEQIDDAAFFGEYRVVPSIEDMVEQLNTGAIRYIDDVSIVFSEAEQTSFILYRSAQFAEAWKYIQWTPTRMAFVMDMLLQTKAAREQFAAALEADTNSTPLQTRHDFSAIPGAGSCKCEEDLNFTDDEEEDRKSLASFVQSGEFHVVERLVTPCSAFSSASDQPPDPPAGDSKSNFMWSSISPDEEERFSNNGDEIEVSPCSCVYIKCRENVSPGAAKKSLSSVIFDLGPPIPCQHSKLAEHTLDGCEICCAMLGYGLQPEPAIAKDEVQASPQQRELENVDTQPEDALKDRIGHQDNGDAHNKGESVTARVEQPAVFPIASPLSRPISPIKSPMASPDSNLQCHATLPLQITTPCRAGPLRNAVAPKAALARVTRPSDTRPTSQHFGLIKGAIVTVRYDWVCDACELRKGACSDAARYRCAACDFDLCEKCVRKFQGQGNCFVVCPQGHGLTLSRQAAGP